MSEKTTDQTGVLPDTPGLAEFAAELDKYCQRYLVVYAYSNPHDTPEDAALGAFYFVRCGGAPGQIAGDMDVYVLDRVTGQVLCFEEKDLFRT